MRIVYLLFMAVVFVFAQNNTISSDDDVIDDPLVDELIEEEEEDDRDYYVYSFTPNMITYADTYSEFCDTKTGKNFKHCEVSFIFGVKLNFTLAISRFRNLLSN